MVDTASKQTNANGNVSDDLNAAKKAAMEAYENLLEAKDKFKSAAHAAGVDAKDMASHKIEESVEMTQQKATDAYTESQRYIIDNPLKSVGIAFASGFIFAKLFGK